MPAYTDTTATMASQFTALQSVAKEHLNLFLSRSLTRTGTPDMAAVHTSFTRVEVQTRHSCLKIKTKVMSLALM